ncbi:dipeptidase 1 (renal) [Phlyctochytrium bullatum]|nr:dipeptidase 1 (renal) [Phlyctochytrium bullatum]
MDRQYPRPITLVPLLLFVALLLWHDHMSGAGFLFRSPCDGDAALESAAVAPPANEDPLERAHRILRRAPIIDTHNDLPIKIRERNGGAVGNLSLYTLPDSYNTDFTRMFRGKVGAQFWSASDFAEQSDDIRDTLDQIGLIKLMIESYPDILAPAFSARDVHRIRGSGKIASLIGIEGAHQIDGSFSTLRQIAWADSCAPPPLHNGLTKDGERFIKEMNRLGMMVDLSHVSDKTMHDVLNVTRAPVIFSHSSVRSICPHPRNVPDDVLGRLYDNDGVVMINFSPGFVSCGVEARNGSAPAVEPKATMEEVADHIEYVVKLVGARYVGLGSDFDGIPSTPLGLEDVSKYPELIAELLRRGLSEEDVIGIAGGNILRVFQKVEDVSKKMKREGVVPEEGWVGKEKTCKN